MDLRFRECARYRHVFGVDDDHEVYGLKESKKLLEDYDFTMILSRITTSHGIAVK